MPPKEFYLLEIWSAPAVEPTIVRLTSAYAQHTLHPPALLVIPEGEAGIAASVRIGRDVDAKPGARTFSGELGSVHAERTIRGTRRRLFRWCSHLMSWSSYWVEGASWMYSRGGPIDGDDYAPGVQGLGWSNEHRDQLTGTTGCIRWTFVEVEKPQRAVRDWEWLINANRPNPMWTERVPVLAEPSRMTVTMVQSRDEAGDPWTTISIDHEKLPVEWLDDMDTYWNYQLSIAEHAGFGTANRRVAILSAAWSSNYGSPGSPVWWALIGRQHTAVCRTGLDQSSRLLLRLGKSRKVRAPWQ